MGKILISTSHFDTLCLKAWKLLEDHDHEIIYDSQRKFPAYSFAELKPMLGKIDAAIIGMDVYDEAVFALAPKLKAVAKFGVGVDNIDGTAAKLHGVKVLNAPGQNANAVAELVVALMINVLRGVIPLHKEMEKGHWPRRIGKEIKGKTVGLVGFGMIARLLAEKLQGFGARLIAFDISPDWQQAEKLNVEIVPTMEEIVHSSDMISLHIPASPEMYHMINRDVFHNMKDGVYLINAARGGLVDLDALAQAMRDGKIAGAALDAFEVEPLPHNASILQCSNIVLLPHIGAETEESYENVSLCVARDIIAVLEGKEPRYCTNR